MDDERILSKLDELDGYLNELDEIKPNELEDYQTSIEKKRACERLLQISIETLIDICNIFVSDLKLGLPLDEDDVLNKILYKKILSKSTVELLRDMKGFRNILVHKYGELDDELVFEMLLNRLEDFEKIKKEILKGVSNFC